MREQPAQASHPCAPGDGASNNPEAGAPWLSTA